jgi:hypothetical protein
MSPSVPSRSTATASSTPSPARPRCRRRLYRRVSVRRSSRSSPGAAKGAAKSQAQREYGKEFGATSYIDANGVHVKPKNAVEGVLHDNAAEAQAVADKLNRKPLTLQHGGFTQGREDAARSPASPSRSSSSSARPATSTPSSPTSSPAPAEARRGRHSKAPGAKVLRQSGACSPAPCCPTARRGFPGRRSREPSCRRPGRRPDVLPARPQAQGSADPELYKQLLTVLCLPGRSAR